MYSHFTVSGSHFDGQAEFLSVLRKGASGCVIVGGWTTPGGPAQFFILGSGGGGAATSSTVITMVSIARGPGGACVAQ